MEKKKDECRNYGYFHWEDLLDALVEWGSDPMLIESEEDAKSWAEIINEGFVSEVTDPDEIEEIKPKLDLQGFEVKHIFAFINESGGGCFCLAQDY